MPRSRTLNPDRRRLRNQPPASDWRAGAVRVEPVRERGAEEPAGADRGAFVVDRGAGAAERAGFAVAPAGRLDDDEARLEEAAPAPDRGFAAERCFDEPEDEEDAAPLLDGVDFDSPPAGIDGFFTGASRTRRRLSGVPIGTPESLQVTMLRR